MGRSELVEIIYQLRCALEEQETELDNCRRQLTRKCALNEQNALTGAMKDELRAAVEELRGDVTEPLRAQIDALQTERDALKDALNAQNATWTHAGSLAEAVVAVNGLMEDAQRAADQYLANVKQSERAAADVIANARAEAARIVQAAQEQADAIRAQSEHEKAERMTAFQQACRALIEQQEALRGLLGEKNHE